MWKLRNLFRKAPADSAVDVQLKPNEGQGPYTKGFKSFVPGNIDAAFYEFLREAFPIADRAINLLSDLDGWLDVEGDNSALVEEIKEWLFNVSVNETVAGVPLQKGVQAFHQSLTSEVHEQGFALGEFVVNKKRNDIINLRVADSKTIKFKRETATAPLLIYQKVKSDASERCLKPDNLLYLAFNVENQNPYGVPLLRSTEFVAKLLKTIENSELNVFERFGDPAYSLTLKTNKRETSDAVDKTKTLSDKFKAAIAAKRKGESADFVTVIDKDSDLTIKVIGADGQVLEMEYPARYAAEQMIAKTGLPPWIYGFHWATTQNLSDAEVAIVMAGVYYRQGIKMPLFFNLIRTLLLLRGRTWKKGDWSLVWRQVNLYDIYKQAQANFLNAQAGMMRGNTAPATPEKKDSKRPVIASSAKQSLCACGKAHGVKETLRPMLWPELDKVETDYENELKFDWGEFQERVLTILKLNASEKQSKVILSLSKDIPLEGIPPASAFTFSEEQTAAIMDALKNHIGQYDWRDTDSSVRWYYGQSYSLGLIQAVNLIGKDRPILDIIKNREIYEELCKSGFEFLKDDATKAIVEKIIPEMQAQMLAGTNPRHVASRLSKLFEDQNSDWERLARSEMTMAAETAKKDEWKEWGIKTQDFDPAPDACPLCLSLAGEYPIEDCPVPARDTHPRCRCSTRPGKYEG